MRTSGLSRWAWVFVAASIGAPLLCGCRVSENDVGRWEATEHGPDKLVAVVTHDKYDTPLRVQAALALVRMKPRGGRRVGISRMVEAVASLPPPTRTAIIAGMLPTLIQEMAKAPPVPQPGQPVPPDGSIPFKDAAYGLLSFEPKYSLLSDPEAIRKLADALVQWCAADFEHRHENPSQMYGVEQVIRFIGSAAAKPLVALIVPSSRKIADLAKIVAENGDAETKEEASKKLVDVAQYMASQKWLDEMKPIVEEADRASGIKVTPETLQKQLEVAQDEQMEKTFGSMRKVGGRAVVEYCLAFAADKKQSDKRRTQAIAAAEGNFDQKNPNDVQRILALAAADDTPDTVRDLAFARVGEMPRDRVINKLYEIFGNKKWQVRWVAAQVVVKMSDTTQIPEFMHHLPQGRAENFSMTEAVTYAEWMTNTKIMTEKDGKTAQTQLAVFQHDPNVALRTVALSWFYAHAKKEDLSKLTEFEGDKTPTPKCDDKQKECEWKCFVPKESDPKQKESKDVTTVGDFVKYCIEPAIQGAK